MKSNIILSREEAGKLLSWGGEQNPGPWTDHCKVVARAAETIAHKCGLDTERAYVFGLLHDIGYYAYRDRKGKTSHIYTGYELMTQKGCDDIARICLSHSFPYPCKDIKALSSFDANWTDEGLLVINAFLSETTYDDYDKLIQLCDCLGTAQGVVVIEKRLMDVTKRHGFNDFTIKKWGAFFSLKEYFDKTCGMNIYNLFCDEIKADIFG